MQFIGNKKAVSFLQKCLEKGNVNHAYIFSGPQHLGKFSLAKKFSQAVIKNEKFNFELDATNQETVLDLILIEPEISEKNGITKQKDISIESIREAQQKLSLFPYHGKKKILIINDSHRLNVSAQNALLKTLEEPNQTSMIILITHDLGKILPTIQSRCQIVNFGLVDDEEIGENFPNKKNAHFFSMGRPGIAVSGSGEDFFKTKEELNQIFSAGINERMKLAEEASKDVILATQKMNIWIWSLEKMARESQEKKTQIFQKIEMIEYCLDLMKNTNSNARLLLENLFLNI